MIQYCIETSIAWSVFILIYILFLQKDTFFRTNRWYLLHTLWIGGLLPLIRKIPFQLATSDNPIAESAILLVTNTQVIISNVSEANACPSNFLPTLLMLIYLAGVLVTTLRFANGLRKIRSKYIAGKKIQKGGLQLIISEDYHLPFSFMNYIFLHRSFLENENIQEILDHENAHVIRWHTIDVLIVEVFAILFWWNPIIYLYKKLSLIHI